MATDSPKAAGPSRWVFPLLLGLTAIFLSPLLGTGYVSDDAVDSLLPGVLKVEGYTLAEFIWCMSTIFIKGGRFFPLQMAEFYTWFYVVQTEVVHKAMVIACAVVDVALFYLLIRRVAKDAAFAAFATCLVFPLFQFRTYFDPILSFYGLLQLVVAGILASLLTLQAYLDTSKARWLLASVATYLIVMLMYEVTYPLFLLHLLLIAYGRRAWKDRIVLSLPFAGVGGLCILASSVLRRLFLSNQSAYRINLDPLAFLSTLTRQTASALPLSYYFTNPAGLYPEAWDIGAMVRFMAGSAGGVGVFVVTLMVCLKILGHLPASSPAEGSPPRRLTLMALLGLLLGILPAVLVSTSVKHQAMIRAGIGYLPVYVQYFGVALLLAVLAWYALSRTAEGGASRRWLRGLTAVLVAVTAGVTYRANATLVDRLETPTDSPHFNPEVGSVWGSWNHHRRNLESALRAGLLENVPEHSVVHLTNEYPAFHDRPHSRYFYAMHSGKVVETIPLTSQFGQDCWFQRKASLQPRVAAMISPPFLLRDACLGKKAGYVVLSRGVDPDGGGPPGLGGEGGAGEIRIYARHPKLFEGGSVPALMLSGVRPGPAMAAGAAWVVRPGRELTMVRSGRDWAILSLRPGVANVDPSSLTLAFGAISASWGEGFDPPQVRDNHWWRRGERRGVLNLNNATDAPRQIRISMLLLNPSRTPLVLSGDPVHAEVSMTGSDPVRFERELTLAPGSHPVEFRPAGEPFPPSSKDPQSLDFLVMDFKIEGQVRR